MANPLENYKARSWSVYEITVLEGQSLPTDSAEGEFLVVRSDSDYAVKLAESDSYDPSRVFFPDFEQLSAGRNVYGFGPIMRLNGFYGSHVPGALCFVSLDGFEKDPPCYSLFIEN